MWLVLSVLNFIPTFILVSNWVSLFFFMVFVFSLNVLTWQAYVGANVFLPFPISLDFLSFFMSYSEIRLQSNGDKAFATVNPI